MAYRRKHAFSRASTFTEDLCSSSSNDFSPRISRFSTFKEHSCSLYDDVSSPTHLSSSPISSQAIHASSTHFNSPRSAPTPKNSPSLNSSRQDLQPYEYTIVSRPNEHKFGLWGVVARKARSILEEDDIAYKSETPCGTKPHIDTSTDGQLCQSYQSPKAGSPQLQKGLLSSVNPIGNTIGNALLEGLTVVENRTADTSVETLKLHVRRKGSDPDASNQETSSPSPHQPSQNQVALAMAAKAKLLLRELNTTKADLAFAKERCAQMEEENKILRESREKGVNPEDDDLIRLQLETLLAEKSRLANENSTYTRENRFLREIVEYHQLTTQDVIYVDEGTEEVTEIHPIPDTTVVLEDVPNTKMVLDGVPPKPPVLATSPGSVASPTFLDITPTLTQRKEQPSTELVSPNFTIVSSREDNKQDRTLQPSSI